MENILFWSGKLKIVVSNDIMVYVRKAEIGYYESIKM